MEKLLFILIFVMPAGIMMGFAILNARWNKVLFVFAGMTLLTTWSLFHDGRESRLPIMPLVAALQFGWMAAAVTLGLAARLVRRFLSRRQGGFATTPQPAEPIRWPGIVLGAALAFYLPMFLTWQGAFSRVYGAVLFIGLGIIIVAAVIASVILLRSKSFAPAATAASCVLSLVALMSYALHTGATVRSAAKMLAQGKPYCIQSGNTLATEVWDLTVLNLRARSGPNVYLNYHALLVVREDGTNQFYNWSYYRGQFQPAIMTYKPDLICTPQLKP